MTDSNIVSNERPVVLPEKEFLAFAEYCRKHNKCILHDATNADYQAFKQSGGKTMTEKVVSNDGIIPEAFDYWRKDIKKYMKDNKLTENSKIPATYKELFNQLDVQERGLLFMINKIFDQRDAQTNIGWIERDLMRDKLVGKTTHSKEKSV